MLENILWQKKSSVFTAHISSPVIAFFTRCICALWSPPEQSGGDSVRQQINPSSGFKDTLHYLFSSLHLSQDLRKHICTMHHHGTKEGDIILHYFMGERYTKRMVNQSPIFITGLCSISINNDCRGKQAKTIQQNSNWTCLLQSWQTLSKIKMKI